MNIKHPFRLALTSVLLLVIALLIIVEIFKIQSVFDASEIDQIEFNIKTANRGNIYTHDYKLLAVNSVQYDLRLDAVFASKFSQEDLKLLDNDLSRIFNDRINYYRVIKKAQKRNNKYLLLKDNITFLELEEIKKMSYYKKTMLGGLIIHEEIIRKNPNYAQRTIGHLYKNKKPKYGLEYSYNNHLMGRNGRVLQVHDPGAEPRSIDSPGNIDPIDGKDLITTIDLDLQDIVHEALLRQLEKHEAEFGTSILMDVHSGEIRAISNLKKIKNKKYAEVLNFAVAHQIEPGSTFKLACLMAYLEDSNGSIEDTIDCKNGSYRFKGAPIDTKDTSPLSIVSIKEAFAKSSNIGVGRLIQNYYKDPQIFIDRLYTFGLGDQSKIDLHGIPYPYIPSPKDNNWSLISLPWMSFGYGLKLTSLDLLTFYNAIANNGVLVHPYLGKYLMDGSDKEKIINNHIKHTICSDQTLQQLKILLQEVVDNGTAKKMASLPFFVSGKTGTAVTNPTDSLKKYHASFVGFFPSENPKYSCIVLVDNPNTKIGYYGSKVAVPVFEEIANKIYSFEGSSWKQRDDQNNISQVNTNSPSMYNEQYISPDSIIKYCNHNTQLYPDLVGYHISDAMYILESIGFSYVVKGDFGHVVKQYPEANSRLKEGLAMTLFI